MLQPWDSPRRSSLRVASVLLAACASWTAVLEASAAATLNQHALLVTYPLVGAAFVLIGALAWNRRPQNGTGSLLCIVGLLIIAAATTDIGLAGPLPAVGVLLAETPIAATLHVVLAFPAGKVVDPVDRGLVAALYAVVLLRQLPLVLPGPDLDPFRTACSLIGAAILIIAAVRLFLRVRRQNLRLRERWVLDLVYGYGMALLLFFPFSARVLMPWFGFDVITLSVIQIAGLTVLPFVFVYGLLQGGFARTYELDEFAAWLGSRSPGAASLQGALARVLGDPSLRVIFPRPTRDSADESPSAPPGRGIVHVLGTEGIDAGVRISYDESLFADAAPVEQAGRVASVALEREQLRVELLAEQEALRASRARVVEFADQQRRQLAQDLHDGVQSRLTLAALHAGRLANVARDREAAIALDQLRHELDRLITEFRQVVHGVMPALLVERGLAAAVEDLVDRLPVPAHLSVSGAAELSPAVATHSYFIVAEALTNAIRHAQATRIRVAVTQRGGELVLGVQDDGVGGAAPTGAGLRGIADRVEVLAGRMHLDSPPGGGTKLAVVLPCG